MDEITTARKMITEQMDLIKDSWDNVVAIKVWDSHYWGPDKFKDLPISALDNEFDAGYGSQGAPHYYVWTKDYIYTDTEYDGADGCLCLPRNPPQESLTNAYKDMEND